MRFVVLAMLPACAPADTETPNPVDVEDSDVTLPDTETPLSTDTADTAATTTDPPSRCTIAGDTITCDHETTTVWTGFTGLYPRDLHWQVPLGTPPADGWPVAFVFQGSFFPAELNWHATRDATLGMWNQAMVTKRLLDNGFAVLTPEAKLGGGTFWDTNIVPYNLLWETSEDHVFMLDLFEGVVNGDFGDLDPSRPYATGISSGGYMSSRMALSYPGRFRALAIHSASWATCSGPFCVVPAALPADHPPTLFLHGEADTIVPYSTVLPYVDGLTAQGTEVSLITDPDATHEWIDPAPTAIVAWFQTHP